MSRNAAAVRRDIERARMEMGGTLEAIGDRVAPKKVVARTKETIHEKVDDVKGVVKEKASPSRLVRRPVEAVKRSAQTVMGTAEQKKDELAGKAGAVTHSVAERAQQAQGNPMAAGVLAFAAGFFAASLLKPSERERDLADRAKEFLEPVKQEALERGKQVAQGARAGARQGLHEVAEKAQEAAAEVKEEAAGAARSLTSGAKARAAEVSADAKRAATAVKRGSTRTGPASRSNNGSRARSAPPATTPRRRTTAPGSAR